MAVLRGELQSREEQQSELRRYLADGVAARLPLMGSLFAGALSGLAVFLVPVVVVFGSMLLVSVTYNFGVWPLEMLLRLFGWARGQAAGGAGTAATGRAGPPAARPTEVLVASPVEATLDSGSLVNWGAVVLVVFWPVAMLVIGAILAAVYRARRHRRLLDLERAPVEVQVFPEMALFYALTAGAALLVGVGSFVAVGLNVIFAWAGYLIWRWLYDLMAWRLAPAWVRKAATDAVDREQAYRKRLREEG